MVMDIQPITPALLPGIADLYVRVFNGAPWHDAWTIDRAHQRLDETLRSPNAFGWVACREDIPVAAVLGVIEPWYDGDHAYIKECFVDTMQQRQGIGRSLMEAAERALRARAVAKMYLLTERDGTAFAFYQALGFAPSRRMTMLGKWLVDE
jgi:ribosomal protein S18 acetylase RimI-like enzyme